MLALVRAPALVLCKKMCGAMRPLLLLRGTQCAGCHPLCMLCVEQQRQPLCLLTAEVLGEMLRGIRHIVYHRCVWGGSCSTKASCRPYECC